MKNKNFKLGDCPYCKGEDIQRDYSEYQREYHEIKPYVIFDCFCNECEMSFSEYFSVDETKLENEEEAYYTDVLSKDDKEVLIKALNLLVEEENDTNDYTKIFNILKDIPNKYN
jgi:hypothetical protein